MFTSIGCSLLPDEIFPMGDVNALMRDVLHRFADILTAMQQPSPRELRAWYDVSGLTPEQRQRFYVALVDIALQSSPRKIGT
ncbi:hypothetical protein CTA21_16490 [Salmonella enterica]|nr:hypothetical protein [Salmonella enterica]